MFLVSSDGFHFYLPRAVLSIMSSKLGNMIRDNSLIDYDVVSTEWSKTDLEAVVRFMFTGYVAEDVSESAKEAFKDLGIDLGLFELEKVPLEQMPKVSWGKEKNLDDYGGHL